jgi:hypothetical protein
MTPPPPRRSSHVVVKKRDSLDDELRGAVRRVMVGASWELGG